MRLLHLHGRKTCDRILRQGFVWKGKHMLIRWMRGAPRGDTVPGLYFGTLASTKLDKSAVKRNRMRRRCREAFRLLTKEDSEVRSAETSRPNESVASSRSFQLLLSPRSSSLSAPFGELQADARRFLSSLPR